MPVIIPALNFRTGNADLVTFAYRLNRSKEKQNFDNRGDGGDED